MRCSLKTVFHAFWLGTICLGLNGCEPFDANHSGGTQTSSDESVSTDLPTGPVVSVVTVSSDDSSVDLPASNDELPDSAVAAGDSPVDDGVPVDSGDLPLAGDDTASGSAAPSGGDQPQDSGAHVIAAFPGAEGHGAAARGGRGGVVVKVTNLNDSGPGSLRAALMMTQPRMIVFDVSGTIELAQQIRLKSENSFFTVAGQTAPGDGIAIRNHKLVMDGVQQGIVRHLRLRHGCERNCTVGVADNLTLLGNTRMLIFDHLSMTWAEDEVMDVWGSNISNITFQWSIMGEGTVFCVEGASQNLGPLVGGGDRIEKITFANNFIVHTCYRNFMQSGGSVSYLNNMSYNTFKLDYSFSQHPVSTQQISADIIGHYFREGPQSSQRMLVDVINSVGSEDREPVSLYISDITPLTISGELHPRFDNDPYALVSTRGIGSSILPEWKKRDQPLALAQFPVTLVPSADVPEKILAYVGASLPKRDAVDQRLVDSFHSLAAWDSANLRQYPELHTYDIRTDSDGDGMEDTWEVSNGLNPLDPLDHAGDINNDGYTNIENFINGLD